MIADANIVLARRFHATVLPLVMGIPILGIFYHRKGSDLLHKMEQEKYYGMFDDLGVEEAYEKFKLLDADLDLEIPKIEQYSKKNIDLVEQQYADLASLFSV